MAFKLNTDISQITNRNTQVSDKIITAVSQILTDIKTGGDTALRKYISKLDGYTGENLLATTEEINAGVKNAGQDFTRILERAKEQITEYHITK